MTDIGYGLVGIPRGRFPRTSEVGMPSLTADADGASTPLWAMVPKYLDGRVQHK